MTQTEINKELCFALDEAIQIQTHFKKLFLKDGRVVEATLCEQLTDRWKRINKKAGFPFKVKPEDLKSLNSD